MAFKLKGIANGAYNVSMSKPENNAKGCVWGLYVLDGDLYGTADTSVITTALDAMSEGVQKIGEVDTYASLESNLAFGVADFNANREKEYIFLFRAEREGMVDEGETKPSNNSTRFISIMGITLDGTYVESVDTSLTYDKIGVDEEIEVIATQGTMNTGEVASDMSETAFINYEIVEGKDVLALSEDGKTITSKKEGTAILETTVIVGGTVLRDRDTIEVKNAYKLAGVSVLGNNTAYIGKNFRIVPAVIMGDDSEVIPSGMKVTYEVVSGGEFVEAVGNGFVAKEKVGEATVRVKVNARGKTLTSDAITLYVTDEFESLSGTSFVYTPSELKFEGKEDELKCEIINIEKEGRYHLVLNAVREKNSGIVDIWMVPYSDVALSSLRDSLFCAYKLGSADLYAKTTENNDIVLPDVVFDKAGEYILVAVISGKNEKSTGYSAVINNISFDGISVVNEVLTDVDSPKLGAGELTSFEVSARLSNGHEIPIEEAELEYVYDSELITVDADKKTLRTNDGVVNTTTDLTVKVIYQGVTAVGSATIVIDKKYSVNTDKKAMLYGDTVFYVGNLLSFTPAVLLNDNTVVKIEDRDITYKIEENVDGALEFDTDGKTIRTIKEGTAVVSATVKFRGNTYESEKVSVSVTGDISENPNIEMYFTKEGNLGETIQYLTSVGPYTANRKWKFETAVGHSNVLSFGGDYSSFVFNPESEDKYLVLRIKIPSAGKYNITAFSNWCRSRSGRFDMYIVPANAENLSNITGNMLAENFVGYMDFYVQGLGTVGEVIDVCSGYEFKNGGEYLVILNLVPGLSAGSAGVIVSSRGDAVYPTYISFIEVNAMTSAEITADKEVIATGESTGTSLVLKTVENLPIDVNEDVLNVRYYSMNPSVATVDKNGVITGVSEGDAEICCSVSYAGITKKVSLPITVIDGSELLGLELSTDLSSIYVYGGTEIFVKAKMASGKVITVPEKYVTWNISDPSLVEIEDGYVTGKNIGSVAITAQVSSEFKSGADMKEINPLNLEIVWDATIDPAIYTLEERENAKKNIERYSWAKTRAKNAINKADGYLEDFDAIYAMMSPEGLPRSYHVGHKYDPNIYNCRYCQFDIATNSSIYGWSADPIARPWKIQCPGCKRLFPSNDFGSFYELGLSESKTYWNYFDALQKHHELFVCSDVKAGKECSHTAPSESAPEPGSAQWIADDPRNEEWYAYYGYGVEGGYLTNDLYDTLDAGWGVDDGFGYRQEYISDPGEIGYHGLYYDDGKGFARYKDGTHTGPVQHTYIAYYLHESVWFGAGGSSSTWVVKNALTAFRDAFLYTGEAKYARAGAMMLDRAADLYPGFEWYLWSSFRGDSYRGKIVDPVWNHHLDELFATSYDAFLPIYNDKELVETLSENALYEMDSDGNYIHDENGEKILINAKDSPGALRKNIEDGILLETFRAVKENKVWGNVGVHHKAVATAAIALNKMPETGEMLEWLMLYDDQSYNSGEYSGRDTMGGSLARTLVELVDYDGHGNENSSHYNYTWAPDLFAIAEMVAGYEKYPAIDMFKNPKYMKMFTAQMKTTLGGYYGAQIGDSSYTATKTLFMNFSTMCSMFNITGDPDIARAVYLYNKVINNGDETQIRGTIFDADPEGLADRIKAVVEEYGEFDLSGTMMAGFGFSALRAGGKFDSVSVANKSNTHRDFAMYYGSQDGHGHLNALNLYMSAFGLNVAPDLGYPEQTGNQPNRMQWVWAPLSHNLVVVNESNQSGTCKGTPYHFDSEGRVKVMDAASNAYPDVNEYRRSLIMVDVNDDVSYGVDFFHVNGGEDHIYSFHSQSDEISAISGLENVVSYPTYTNKDGELIGTYAGPDVPFGPDPGGNYPNNVYPLGYTWLKNVRTYKSPEKNFTVEFKVKDWRKILEKKQDIRLRMTMVSDEPMKEVSFVTGLPPQRSENKEIGELEYVLVRNKGKNLDTTFTTVFEPYIAGEKYIKNVQKLSMERDSSSRPGLYDSYSAVKVEHENGRVDYVIYSTNTEVLYTVVDGDTEISFRGFAGVMTVENGNVVYRYLNDGDVLEFSGSPFENTAPKAYTGTVADFTTDLVFDNFITYTPTSGEIVDTELIKGRYVYIENDGMENAVYEILDAEAVGANIKLTLGNTTLIRSYIDLYDMDAGYVYNISKGQSLRIPLSEEIDSSPIVEFVADVTTSAGSTVTIPFSATSPLGKTLSFSNSVFPRGMSVDADRQTLTWKPDNSQVGKNHVTLSASDGTLETIVHLTVTVYGATSGSSGNATENSGTSGEGTGSAGGGGGAAPDSTQSDEKDSDESLLSPEKEPSAGEADEVGKSSFTDLGKHAWAEDAINTLAQNGIIRGTSENTFSPSANITRADFALLLVRAFNLTSDNADNFTDVSASDYFASELAIARNTGIVGGIGDNKYAPRNSITRQDMMVIVYRALTTLEKMPPLPKGRVTDYNVKCNTCKNK
ncbi:MAG: S-layer homology domain-containing protein [Oscillospiraceae bacterium]|nr:S-layer homology domain-containing protein [Oscillospiraceae bacterium]